MQLGLLPRLDIHQTSEEAIGQVYVPQINWMLMVCVLGLVLWFGSWDNLAAAYGIAVAGTMVITTSLLAVVAHRLWRWSLPVTMAVIGFFLVVDLAFFAANAVKIPQGGWFPLLVGAVMFMLMSTWRRGRQIVLERTSEDNPPLLQFIAQLDPAQLPRVKGTAVYLAARRETAPYSLLDNIRHNKVLHERIVLLTVVTERAPFVTEAERMQLEPLDKGFTERACISGSPRHPPCRRPLRRTEPSSRSISPKPLSSSGGKRPFPRSAQNCRCGAKSYTRSWAATPSAPRITSRSHPSASSSWGPGSNSSRTVQFSTALATAMRGMLDPFISFTSAVALR
jgi:KUP system potassium uptake protein